MNQNGVNIFTIHVLNKLRAVNKPNAIKTQAYTAKIILSGSNKRSYNFKEDLPEMNTDQHY